MKYRIASLIALLAISFFSAPALADPYDRSNNSQYRHGASSQRHSAPSHRYHYRGLAPLPSSEYALHQQLPGRPWRMGEVLSRMVIYYDVPLRRYNLAPPPRGYRYVRVGNDILLIAIRSGLIVNVLYDVVY
jgi:Ni/Co efflux regulator RcnB